MSDSLTLKDFQGLIDKVFPILYYAVSQFVERGFIYVLKESDLNPKCIVCHPDDLERIEELLPTCRLVPLCDESKEKQVERMLKQYNPIYRHKGDEHEDNSVRIPTKRWPHGLG